MTSPPSAEHVTNPARLVALRRTALLDSPADEAFDRLTRLAAQLLSAPLAAVSLVEEDRPFFKSCIGVPEPPWATARESPRCHTFCQHVVSTAAPLVIEDAREHPLVRDDRAVSELGVVAYLGIPLITREGDGLGSFSVIDGRPRRWTDAEIGILTDLAASVVTEIELRMDLSERQHVEEAAFRSEARYRAMMQASAQIVWTTDPAGETVEEQPSWSAFTGQSLEEQLGMGWLNAVHPDDRAETAAVWLESLEKGTHYSMEHRVLRHDGEYRHMRVHGVPVRDPDGGIREWVGAEADVTEERREEERQRFLAEASAILSSSLDYRTTLRSVARLAVPSIADHCVVDVIEDGRKIVRVEVVFADGRRAPGYTSLSSPDWSSPQPAVQAMRSGTPVLAPEIDDAWLANHARSPEHLAALRQMGLRSLLAVPLLARGRTLGAITLSTGESGRHLGPQDLALAEEMAHRAALAIDNARLHGKAQRATRAREEILAVVSHELRGPLNVIDQGLEALIDLLPPEMWPSAGRRQLASMRGAANQSLVLVQDLLDITEIDAGHLKVRLRREEVASLVTDALALMEPVAAAKSIRLEAHVPEGLPAVLVDRQRILQVLGNLVENAVRATPKGGVITVSVAPAGTQVRFSVADEGPGMTRQQLEHAFDRSWQVSGADRRSGLGLAIARGIVKAHKGAIGAESRGERGSTCFFTLPAVDEAGASAPWYPDVEADDQTASAEVAIASLLTRRGDEGGSKRQAARAEAAAADRSTRFLDTMRWERQDAADGKRSASEHLRYHILSALYLGNLRPGDRLPSVRQVTEDLGVPFRSVVQAYAALALEGVVEKRDRSGVFVAEQEPRKGEALGETASWLANILMDAFTHQIRIPQLRRALHDWTAGRELRCACVDSIADRLVALSDDVTRYFGIDTSSVSADHLAAFDPKGGLDRDALPRAVREADFLLTTPFHATTLRQIAARLNKPLVIATVHPEISAAIRCQVQKGRVTMVCADRRFGEQLRGCLEGAYYERFRIVLAEDAAAVAELDPAEPVLLTRAAQQVLGTTDLRLLIPLSPSFSAATALHLSRVLIQLNMNGLRR